MPLTETLPLSVQNLVTSSLWKDADLLISVPTDLTLHGEFGEEWVVVSAERLAVVEPDSGTPRIRLDVPLSELKNPAVENLVGGSSLGATVDGEPVELARYSNARQADFSRVARYLGDVAKYHEALDKGEEEPEVPELHEDTEEAKRCPTCNLLLPEGTKVCPACLDKGKVFRRLMGYVRPYWKQAAIVWTLMFVTTLLNLIPPALNRPLIDRVLAPKDHIGTTAERMTLLGWLVLGLLVTQALGQVVGIVRGRIMVWLGGQLSHDLRTQLYQHLQVLSLKFFDKRQTGAIMSRVSQDTESLQDVLTDGAQFLVVNMLTLIGIGIVLMVMNWKLTLLILIPAPVVALLSRFFWKRLRRMWSRRNHFRQLLSASLNDSLSGVRVVKAFAQEEQEMDRFRLRSSELFGAGLRADQMWNTYFPTISFIMGLGAMVVWYYGGRQVILGQDMSLGKLIMFISYLGMFYGPMQFISRIADWLARSLASAERVFEILDSEPDVRETDEAVSMPYIEGRVEFRDVTFGYDSHKPVLKNVSLTVEPGEMIGFVGHSGAGKSTTINLICRFYDPQEGEILVDGVPIKRLLQRDLRSQIGVVLQDTFLFNGTVAENIAYARPGASLEEIMAAAKAANAHDFIVSKADGYDTQVGERGQSLSGGERQRISIARAILHNPRILILDEATSSVDTDTEKQIQDAIARLVKGRTTFAIAHRLSTLRNADRLVVLKAGSIEEMGTHDELLQKEGEFYRLVKMQQEMSRITEVSG